MLHEPNDNFFLVPDEFFAQLHRMTGDEVKLFIIICKYTWEFRVPISISNIIEVLKSIQLKIPNLEETLKSLMFMDLIEKNKDMYKVKTYSEEEDKDYDA